MFLKLYAFKSFVNKVSCNGGSLTEIELTSQSIERDFFGIVHSRIFGVYFYKNTNLIQVLKILMLKCPSHYIYYILLFLAFGLKSCSQKSTENRDHLVFRYNQHANISSLDPAFSRNLANIWPNLQLYNGLVQFDENLNLKPDIAKRWEFNDSTSTYTFILREDVYFHKDARFGKDSTRTVTAAD